jgi:transcriptional regulator with XRE-family HTH domain
MMLEKITELNSKTERKLIQECADYVGVCRYTVWKYLRGRGTNVNIKIRIARFIAAANDDITSLEEEAKRLQHREPVME